MHYNFLIVCNLLEYEINELLIYFILCIFCKIGFGLVGLLDFKYYPSNKKCNFILKVTTTFKRTMLFRPFTTTKSI